MSTKTKIKAKAKQIKTSVRIKSIPIDKGVPFPPSVILRGIVYPFASMNKGDSFLVSNPSEQELTHARITVSRMNRDSDKRFVTRTVPEGLRVWRLG